MEFWPCSEAKNHTWIEQADCDPDDPNDRNCAICYKTQFNGEAECPKCKGKIRCSNCNEVKKGSGDKCNDCNNLNNGRESKGQIYQEQGNSKTTNYLPWILGGIGLLAVIGVILYFVFRKKDQT